MIPGSFARLRSAPLALSLCTATLKTAAADVLTQRCIEGAELDVRRTAIFTVFGFWYLGGVQYWLYVRTFSRWFPSARRFGEHASLRARLNDVAGMRELAGQTVFGNFVHIPFGFLPSFYLTQELVAHGRDATPSRALRRYYDNSWSDLVSAWAIWIPGHAIFFSVPLWVRLPTNHAMSFLYVCILSFMRGGGHRERATGAADGQRRTGPNK